MTAKAENKLARSLGWTPVPDGHRGYDWCRFIEGSAHVWLASRIRGGARVPCWVRADLIDNQFTNHKRFETLEEALNG